MWAYLQYLGSVAVFGITTGLVWALVTFIRDALRVRRRRRRIRRLRERIESGKAPRYALTRDEFGHAVRSWDSTFATADEKRLLGDIWGMAGAIHRDHGHWPTPFELEIRDERGDRYEPFVDTDEAVDLCLGDIRVTVHNSRAQPPDDPQGT